MEPPVIIFGISIATILWIALRSSGRPDEGRDASPGNRWQRKRG